MSRWRTTRMRDGSILQSGLNAQAGPYRNPFTPSEGPYRAIVLSTYVSDDEANTRRQFQVTCDVLLVEAQIRLARVPVMQRNFGVNNVHQLWVPKPSTRTITTNTSLNFRPVSDVGSRVGDATPLDDIDGDMVLVDFVEGDVGYPFIAGALEHVRSNRRVISSAPERGQAGKDEYYTSHQGTEVRIDADGNMLIDTVGAHADPINEDVSTGGGEVRFRMKSTRRFVVEMDGTDVLEVYESGGQVRIDLGEGASERLILGDSFRAFLNQFLTSIYGTHVHETAIGPTDPPTPQATQMSTSLLSSLARTKGS